MVLIALAHAGAIEDCRRAHDDVLSHRTCGHLAAAQDEHRIGILAIELGWEGFYAHGRDNRATNPWDGVTAATQAFRAAQCQFSPHTGVSDEAVNADVCWARVRTAHLTLLQRMASGEGARPWSAADADLNATWKSIYVKGDEGLLQAQRAWLAYRDTTCAWVALQTPEAHDACLSVSTDLRRDGLATYTPSVP